MDSFYAIEELKELGLKSFGTDVKISRKVSIYGANNIMVGSHVRIDDFCVISGVVEIGDYVHIAASCLLFAGEAGIVIEDFCGLSSRVTVYAESDDYSGGYLTNPTVPAQYRDVYSKRVKICRHVIVGASCTILPGVTLGEGSSFGSMSLINKDSATWSINTGIPCKEVKKREEKLLQMERDLLEQNRQDFRSTTSAMKNTISPGYLATIEVGETATFEKTISESDVYLYAGITGDFNEVHINQEAAISSIFNGRIAHGMLVAGFISTVLGMFMPGPGTVYLSQTVNFVKPVKMGDTITARATVREIINFEKKVIKLETTVRNQKGDVVVDGFAVVKLPPSVTPPR